ncbi:MAG: FAD:protein FMN transferase [Candidatus Acidiferrum sp.]
MRWSKALASAGVIASMPLVLATPRETKTPLVHKTKYTMGTVYEIAAYDESPEHASQAIDKALAEIVRLDGVLSNYKPDSELSQLNRNGHFHAIKVSADLYRVIEESVKYSKLSQGKYDITVAPLVDMWKAALLGSRAPSETEQQKQRACVGYEKIELTPPDTVEFHSPCMRIDVGSIGKGYALDKAVEILRANGIKNALLDAGQSSIYGMGAPPGQSAWEVHLRDPSNRVDPTVLLRENSVSTSEQTPPSLLGNDTAGHIIDPDNGKPLQTQYALSVVTKTGTASDALSTTLLLVGPDKGKSIVKELAETAAIWVSANGKTETITTGPAIRLVGETQKEQNQREFEKKWVGSEGKSDDDVARVNFRTVGLDGVGARGAGQGIHPMDRGQHSTGENAGGKRTGDSLERPGPESGDHREETRISSLPTDGYRAIDSSGRSKCEFGDRWNHSEG